jgi:hypothetical protein
MGRFDEEINRTAFQRKVVSRLSADEVVRRAISFFTERGYRAGRMGRAGQVFVLGKGEGGLPRVTGELDARADVGKPGTTLVTLNAAGERLGPTMAEFAATLRGKRAGPQSAAGVPASARSEPEPGVADQ